MRSPSHRNVRRAFFFAPATLAFLLLRQQDPDSVGTEWPREEIRRGHSCLRPPLAQLRQRVDAAVCAREDPWVAETVRNALPELRIPRLCPVVIPDRGGSGRLRAPGFRDRRAGRIRFVRNHARTSSQLRQRVDAAVCAREDQRVTETTETALPELL